MDSGPRFFARVVWGNLAASRIWKGYIVSVLTDRFGRMFPYVRLSITEACNFKCQYCLPNGFEKSCDAKYLSRAEINNLVSALANLGVEKIRITGGEPTTRHDFLDIIRDIKKINGIKTIALTTNGYKLEQQAQEILDAGVNAINISIDSFDKDKFHEITGHNVLPSILRGLEKITQSGLEKIKINCVLLKGVTDNELDGFLAHIANFNHSIRFIELMRTGDNFEYFSKYYLPAQTMFEKLEAKGFAKLKREFDGGPAIEFGNPNYKGKIGIIAPYSNDFCATCNRLRFSSFGQLRLCLFGDGGLDVRPLLQASGQSQELQNAIIEALQFKLKTHDLANNNTGTTKHLAMIGG